MKKNYTNETRMLHPAALSSDTKTLRFLPTEATQYNSAFWSAEGLPVGWSSAWPSDIPNSFDLDSFGNFCELR